jgi:hypothetical protein
VDEHFSPRGRKLSAATAVQMGHMAEPQEILPHRGIVVGEIRETYVTTNIHLGRRFTSTRQKVIGKLLL